ncbi:hypothetical protein KIS1582_0037 [Cytobacillus firmus]|uniref:Uncharacterized protein n=1 Tax=Cytobacillus firmus TaxID=1399 RepID=A0A800NG43_CYTFI|nr:hypothetical protein KIS1582_0037 [Cytobacillus firmus]
MTIVLDTRETINYRLGKEMQEISFPFFLNYNEKALAWRL